MILTANKDKSFIGFNISFHLERNDLNNYANSHNEIENAKPSHDKVKSFFGFVNMHHCWEYESEQKQENIKVLDKVSRLESDVKARDYLRPDENTENGIEESY